MFISKDMAHAMAEGRKKFLSVYEGRSVLFMPNAEQVRYVETHFVPELNRSLICPGDNSCRYHHLQGVAKAHVGAWVNRKAMPYASRDCKGMPAKLEWHPEVWALKIVEITEACLPAFEAGAPYGTLATISRQPGRKNGKVEFAWLHGHVLNNFPPSDSMAPETVVPAVIRGTYYPNASTGLDKMSDGSIKHKSPYRTS